jgi:hypothetical protein
VAVISGGRLMTGARDATLGPYSGSGVPTNGTSGTLVNVAPKGAAYVNTATGIWYVNTGVIANVTWVVLGSQT